MCQWLNQLCFRFPTSHPALQDQPYLGHATFKVEQEEQKI